MTNAFDQRRLHGRSRSLRRGGSPTSLPGIRRRGRRHRIGTRSSRGIGRPRIRAFSKTRTRCYDERIPAHYSRGRTRCIAPILQRPYIANWMCRDRRGTTWRSASQLPAATYRMPCTFRKLRAGRVSMQPARSAAPGCIFGYENVITYSGALSELNLESFGSVLSLSTFRPSTSGRRDACSRSKSGQAPDALR